MKTKILIVPGLLIGIAIFLLVAILQQPKPGSSEEVALLRKRMAGLERELSSVRDKLGWLELRRGNARMIVHQNAGAGETVTNWLFLDRPNQPQASFPSETPMKPDAERLPKFWGEGEFNGWKYYDIPLANR